MKALVLHGANDLRYESVADPSIADPRDIIVKTERCGICGSDLHYLHGKIPTEQDAFCLGHEAVGEVVEVGRGVVDLKVGDRVMLSAATGCGACRACLSGHIKRCENRQLKVYGTGTGLEGCQAEGVRVPAGDFNAARIPEGISADQAIMLTDNLPTAYAACLGAEISPGKSVAVIGLGPIGLCAVELAFVMGASTVYAVDLVAERRERATQLGAIAIAGENFRKIIKEATSGRMLDCIVEAVGGDATTELALSLVGTGGVVSVLGVNPSMKFNVPAKAFANGVTIRGNFLTEVSRYWPALVPLVQQGRIRPERFVTECASLEEGVSAYGRIDRREPGTLKTVLKPA